MAEKWLLYATNLISITIFVSTLSRLPVAFSRSLLSGFACTIPATSTLDVEASIKKSLTHLSPKPNSFRFLKRQSHSSPHVLPLHNRASIQHHIHKNYKSLTQSRLQRDSLRVRSLQSRLVLANNRIQNSNLKSSSAEDLEGTVVSGRSQGCGEYFTSIGIGRPTKPVYVVLDTGSDISWIQCRPCVNCYHQTDPIFDPSSSSSYGELTCNSSLCETLDVSQCRSNRCLYEVSYGDGSYTVGDFATETVTLGGASVDNVAIGCGHRNEGLFAGAAGLLGLGGGALSFPAQINTTSFSYCLVNRDSDSASTLEFNSNIPANAVTVQLLRNSEVDTFYYLQLTGISVAGKLLSLPVGTFQIDSSGNGGVIIDSGTAITRLQAEVYVRLRDAFLNGTRHLRKAQAVGLFDTCYSLSESGMRHVDTPSVAFHFPGDKALTLPAENYIIPVDDAGTFCLAFAPTTSSLSILGNVQQQGTRVTFDLAKSLVGFDPNQC